MKLRTSLFAIRLAVTLLAIALTALPTVKPNYKYVFRLAKPLESASNVFEDERLRIAFDLSRIVFGFTVRNKTEEPLKINWNEAAYVDPDRQSHKIMHSGVRFIERDAAQLPTIVPPGAELTDLLIPTDYVEWESGYSRFSTGWKTREMFPKPEQGQRFDGRSLSIFLPIQTGDSVAHNYNFTFSIEIAIEQKR